MTSYNPMHDAPTDKQIFITLQGMRWHGNRLEQTPPELLVPATASPDCAAAATPSVSHGEFRQICHGESRHLQQVLRFLAAASSGEADNESSCGWWRCADTAEF